MTRADAAPGQVRGRRARSWHAGAVKRVGWGLGDQALSSMTNFAVGILVARSVSVSDFGAYALAFSAYCFILGISRALATEPFAVRFVIGEPEDLHRARAAVTGVALLTGVAFLAMALVLSQMLTEEYRSLAVCLGVSLPGLLVQDSVRQILFGAGRGRSAFNNDLLWAALMAPAFAGVILSGNANSATLILAWGAAATVAAIVGCFQCRVVPGIRLINAWLNSQRGLWAPFLVEGVAINGAQQIVFFAIGGFVGLSAVGEMKLALVLLGPVNVLVQGLGVVAVPEAARALAFGRSRFLRVTSVFSLVVACGALLWGLAVLLLAGILGCRARRARLVDGFSAGASPVPRPGVQRSKDGRGCWFARHGSRQKKHVDPDGDLVSGCHPLGRGGGRRGSSGGSLGARPGCRFQRGALVPAVQKCHGAVSIQDCEV
ncbi:hypothetical protein ACOM2C_18185 [Pseudarthrobacter sp. So.54]